MIVFAALVMTSNAFAGVKADTDCRKYAMVKLPLIGKQLSWPKYQACLIEQKLKRIDLAKTVENEVRNIMEGEFNSLEYTAAIEADKEEIYFASCYAAAIAGLGYLGSHLGGVYGMAAGGAVGTFVAERICIQSTKW